MPEPKMNAANLIQKIEESRKSKVIVYYTGDRTNHSARIAEDAVRPLYDHLHNLNFGERKKKIIDLFLYSRGGDVSVPWRIVSMIREFCDEFNILIPYRAQSAATLLSLGADTIVMGKKAELGPIDPSLVRAVVGDAGNPPAEIAVEDVNSFLSFVRDRSHITDQTALATMMNSLIGQIGPLTLGTVNRQHYHIRLVARKLLTSRSEKIDEEKINTIIETLTEKMYSHGHAIGRKEAKEIGLPVIYPKPELEELTWNLFLYYEQFLQLREPIDPALALEKKDEEEILNMPIAVIESVDKRHIFRAKFQMKKSRKVPENPQININLQLQLPPGMDPKQVGPETQQILNNIMNSVSQQIPRLVQQELIRQSPEIGIMARSIGGMWHEE
ncbi:hypothetical protein [Methanoculleus sp.]|uniref:SDH family Clp fold serine proteinase n=1 Tax=Methanoculleus sp. TaxID=90427 RepID=UPI001BD37F24|nr:hypothetical protein [Methanoculleus sp.]